MRPGIQPRAGSHPECFAAWTPAEIVLVSAAPVDPTRSERQDGNDFLYHLYRGSDLLMQDRVVEAKKELERALTFQPEDARGQDLLAGVYFRLGIYPRAIEIWRQLISDHPDDATLRINLALAMLKTGQPEEACRFIRQALAIDPEHARAWGYLGLILWRLDEPEEAQKAFLRGGQPSMAKRMAAIVENARSASTTTQGSPEGPDAARRRKAISESAASALRALDLAPLSVASPRDGWGAGRWHVDEPGDERRPPSEEPAPMDAPAGRPRATDLSAVLDAWRIGFSEQRAFALSSAGTLIVSSEDAVFLRMAGLRGLAGPLTSQRAARRSANRELPGPLGGSAHPLLRCEGPVRAVVAPPAGRAFRLVDLDEERFYVCEERVWAFAPSLRHESGTLGSGEQTKHVVQLTGKGAVVLTTGVRPVAVPVTETQPLQVDPEALIGWVGNVLPKYDTAPADSLGDGPTTLTFRGDGIVLFE